MPDPVDIDLETGLNVFKTLTKISQVSNTLLKRVLAEQDTKLTLHVMESLEKQLILQAKLQGLFTEDPAARINVLVGTRSLTSGKN